MPTSRRNALTLLGLAPLGGAALALDDMVGDQNKRDMVSGSGGFSTERAARALELLASELRSGGVSLASLKLDTAIEPNTVFEQLLTIRFVVMEPGDIKPTS